MKLCGVYESAFPFFLVENYCPWKALWDCFIDGESTLWVGLSIIALFCRWKIHFMSWLVFFWNYCTVELLKLQRSHDLQIVEIHALTCFWVVIVKMLSWDFGDGVTKLIGEDIFKNETIGSLALMRIWRSFPIQYHLQNHKGIQPYESFSF